MKKLEKIYREEQGKQTKARQKSRAQTNDYIEELAKSATPKEQAETPRDAGRTEPTDKTEAPAEGQSVAKQTEEGEHPETQPVKE